MQVWLICTTTLRRVDVAAQLGINNAKGRWYGHGRIISSAWIAKSYAGIRFKILVTLSLITSWSMATFSLTNSRRIRVTSKVELDFPTRPKNRPFYHKGKFVPRCWEGRKAYWRQKVGRSVKCMDLRWNIETSWLHERIALFSWLHSNCISLSQSMYETLFKWPKMPMFYG